jgi:hypothetical protein
MENVETIAIEEGFKKTIRAGVRHRIRYEEDGAFMDISSNGHKGFNFFRVDVTYYCFSRPNVYRSPIPKRH